MSNANIFALAATSEKNSGGGRQNDRRAKVYSTSWSSFQIVIGSFSPLFFYSYLLGRHSSCCQMNWLLWTMSTAALVELVLQLRQSLIVTGQWATFHALANLLRDRFFLLLAFALRCASLIFDDNALTLLMKAFINVKHYCLRWTFSSQSTCTSSPAIRRKLYFSSSRQRPFSMNQSSEEPR